MAEAEAPSKGKGLGKRVGPLPVWGWAVIIVGGFLGIMIVRKYAGGGATQGLSVGGVGQPTSSDPGATAPPGISAGDFKSTIDALTKEFTDSQTQLADEITQSNKDQAAANKSLADSLASALSSAVSTLQGEINQQTAAQTITTHAPVAPNLEQSWQNWLSSQTSVNDLNAQNTSATGIISKLVGHQVYVNWQNNNVDPSAGDLRGYLEAVHQQYLQTGSIAALKDAQQARQYLKSQY